MASNLPVPSNGSLFPDRYYVKLDRAARREQALIRTTADLTTLKIDALAMVTRVIQDDVDSLSTTELFYAQQHPHAAVRQQLVTDRFTRAAVRRIDRLDWELG